MKRKTLLLTFALWMVVLTAWAENVHTVVSVSGKAWRISAEGTWVKINPGDKLNDDGWVRTGKESNVRLVLADGTMMRIAGGQKRQIVDESIQEEEEADSGFFSVLTELFTGERKSRVAASRGASDGDDGPDSQLGRQYNEQWKILMARQSLQESDLPSLFEVASFYKARPFQNRAVALILKASHSFPQNEGLRKMAKKGEAALGNPAHLTVGKKTGQGSGTASNGEAFRAGDGIQIQYESETESHLYLFFHSVPNSGSPSTMQLYPGKGGEPGVAGGTPVILPRKGSYFTLDDNAGREYIWGWSCLTMVDAKAIAKARAGMIAVIQTRNSINNNTAQAKAPGYCQQGFGYGFDHK